MSDTVGSIPEPARPRRPHGASAAELAAVLGAPAPSTDLTLQGVTLDSRAVEPGDLWCALPGANAHGADFAAQAAARGAVMVLTDPQGRGRCEAAGLAVLEVADPRAATAVAAAVVQGRPSRRLATIGVTGTNGKTSITTAITRTLLALDVPAGSIGTSGTSYRGADGRDHAIATVRTTPEAPELHGLLARMAEDAVETVSMEVSSHALVLHRADEVVFDVACFTNLTQDHLDFHGTMEEYFAAKQQLFTPAHARHGVVCVDDEWGRRLAREAQIPVTTYTTREDVAADHRARDLRAEGYGTTFVVDGPGGSRTLHAALPGRHYVANTLAAELLLAAVGRSGEDVVRALGEAGTVPGRMEPVADAPVRGIVDYSHTPDALRQALLTLRAVPGTRRLLVVMGAGGDRDRTKRPLMGRTAAQLADVVIVTDDNPRGEDPAAIRREVLSGIEEGTTAQVHEVDGRGEAIALAAYLADVADTILVAGKGAETGQTIGGIVHPFDDRLRLRDALRDAHPARGGADDMDEGR
ncbi:UDP-N-acetylmuramoyl-L-alanyl-D-glutamate--2,6-diaminopimelate ligase [Brachybacterium saurashtrense]|uniref:UDP-N-acetylmuramoyl-L-alanyl-D-glutamate--2,6-diaminopimelate ligase n=1 Tax=Brachybacterium saurashtrense TaxID=556288 RepID=A0A345YT85_9MICO|nr:UDP-N-acetylmuramoyl-L-alanyl-D-glutamate--2,6-diaminopimelate ligase [Brachybacterium saurashtrense]AXK47137.1 UDP-N-acetylmuramoyl-L-alanyl-D-glutamate--2,6-diaminopimelate ligase [Brachybacterium saurashtrense]RRR23459.1 UDP-N-acetylmuramoyl-L-alanyl-D-glutamate--2,6-diaminopimelate ligase [Brachybacterium saurashtrense]